MAGNDLAVMVVFVDAALVNVVRLLLFRELRVRKVFTVSGHHLVVEVEMTTTQFIRKPSMVVDVRFVEGMRVDCLLWNDFADPEIRVLLIFVSDMLQAVVWPQELSVAIFVVVILVKDMTVTVLEAVIVGLVVDVMMLLMVLLMVSLMEIVVSIVDKVLMLMEMVVVVGWCWVCK